MLNFSKNIVVGVSVTPDIGLEVAQIDFAARKVLKYGRRQLSYDSARREIADLDIFKETLLDLLTSLEIPKGSDLVLNMPPVSFRVVDYPASLPDEQVKSAIEEDLLELPGFQDADLTMDAVKLPNSTIQFNKYTYTSLQKTALIEIVMQCDEMGYNIIGIDTSVGSTLNALLYNERVNAANDATWLMVHVEGNCCRLISMQGKNYLDAIEERISIGEVLGDAENYATVVSAIDPIIRNLPTSYMYIVSKTNLISAEVLANKLSYNAPIIHQEANVFAKEPFLEVGPDVDEADAKLISIDVIGAAIKREFKQFVYTDLNLFNISLGEVYTSKQPPEIMINGKLVVLSLQNMIVASIIFAVLVLIPVVAGMSYLGSLINKENAKIAQLNADIAKEEQYLKENEGISTELFDEGDEVRAGMVHNKNIYSYFTIVGTEIPKKLWLTSLKLGEHVEIEGQSDNLESIYAFFRNIKDYDPASPIKLQRLGLGTKSKMQTLTDEGGVDTESLLSSMNADFYEFRISDIAVGEADIPPEGDVPPENSVE